MSDIVEAALARMDAPTPPPLTGPTIKVKVLFFASAREMAGCDRYVAELPVGARTSTLRAHLKDKFLLLGEGALDTPMSSLSLALRVSLACLAKLMFHTCNTAQSV